jgi:hypothetical protein
MKYFEDINNIDNTKIMILFLIEKANYYKDKNEELFASYVSLINTYIKKLERLSEHYE